MLKLTLGTNNLVLKNFANEVKGLEKKINQKTSTAINKTARSTRDQMIDQVVAKFNISKRNANRKKVFFQSKKAKSTSLSAQVRLKETKKIGVENFGPRHTGSGVTFALLKGGSRKLIDNAFMGPRPGKKAPKLHGGVFVRQRGAKRLPINKMYALSQWGMYRSDKMEIKTKLFAGKKLRSEITNQIKILSKTL